MTTWKPIDGYENYYEVSDDGRVRSITRTLKLSNRTSKYIGRILKPSVGGSGYYVVNLTKEGKIIQRKIHQLVAETFIGRIGEMWVNHKDANKLNNEVSNLEYVTPIGNSQHAFRLGIKIGKTILNAAQRQIIREERKKGVLLTVLAKRFNMSISAISEVVRGSTWKWENK